MFNVGGGELLVILLIARIVLGPQRLPDAARQIGKTMGELRKISAGFQSEIKSALSEVEDLTKMADPRNVLSQEAPPSSNGSVSAAVDAVSEPSKPAPPRKRTTPLRAVPVDGTDPKKT